MANTVKMPMFKWVESKDPEQFWVTEDVVSGLIIAGSLESSLPSPHSLVTIPFESIDNVDPSIYRRKPTGNAA